MVGPFHTPMGLRSASLLLALVVWAGSPGWGKEESTAHVDLRLLFEQSWQGLYSQPLALQIVQARLAGITEDQEVKDVHNWIWQFAGRGFPQRDYEYCLFRPERQSIRAAFLEVVQPSRYRLTSEFVRQVLESYQASPGTMAFQVFIDPSWAGFTSALADESTYAALTRILNTPAVTGSSDRYCKALYYGYKAYPGRSAELDNDVRKNHLDAAGLTPQKIESLYQELNADYWGGLPAKKEWMLAKTASRLFRDFKPEDWAQMPPATVLSLAQTLSRAAATSEYQPVEVLEWMRKMGESIRGNPEPPGPRTLLVYFLQNSGVGLRSSFGALADQFRDDQRTFLALHRRPPTPCPMDVWQGDGDNWQDSLGMLCRFFDLGRASQWTSELWNCLKERYYSRNAENLETKQRLFRDVLTPLFRSDALDDNGVRRTLLRQTYETGSFLLDSHRYEIAHHFLSSKPMNTPVPLEGAAVPGIDYAIHVYTALHGAEPELYRSSVLRSLLAQRKTAVPESAPERIIAYINHVIGEPLELVCYALMGQGDKTQGVVYGWTDEPLTRLETLLKEIVRLKGELLHTHNVKLPRIVVLDDIAAEIIQAMKTAIQQGEKPQIVKLVRLSLKVTVILEDDAYLERILAALRQDVFRLSDDPARFRRLTPAELQETVRYFTVLHSEDLVEALRAVGKLKYVLMFYEQLYQPLRSIYGFFHEVGAKPYQRFLDEFQSATYGDRSSTMDLPALLDGEVQALGAIHEGSGRQYIDAETAICDLLTSYYDRLKIDVWKDSERFAPNVNVNLGVLYRLLLAKGGAEQANWRLGDLGYEQRAEIYRKIGRVFLDNLTHPELMSREVALNDPPASYSGWEFFSLLVALVDLYEIHGFPFPQTQPGDLYTGAPATGIRRTVLPMEQVVSPRKVDGKFRAGVSATYEKLGPTPDPKETDRWDKLGVLALLLPNREENLRGETAELETYRALKQRVFDGVVALLDKAQDSKTRLHWLTLLSRLEASLSALEAGQDALGYMKARSRTLPLLDAGDVKSLLFEEFLLTYINQRATSGGAPPLEQLAAIVQRLVEALCQEYPLLGGKYDTLAQAILDLYKKTDPDTVLSDLNEEHVAYLWFITRRSSDALQMAVQKGADLTEEEKKNVLAIASSLFFIHSFFAPYVHGEFNVDALLKEERRLCTFCLLDRQVKKPMAQLMPLYQQSWSARLPGWHFDMSPTHLKTFVLCHNFLPIYLLERSLESPKLFVRLAQGKSVSVVTYNFLLLWEREERGQVSLDNLCQEVLDGVDINKDFLLAGMEWSDRTYLEYFFGNNRALLGAGKGAVQIPQNFDTLVSKLALMAFDARYQKILAALEQSIKETTDEEVRNRLQRSLDSARRFPGAIRGALDNGYEYFGRVLAEGFSSPFTIQYACERAWQNVAAKQRTLSPKEAGELYGRFYTSGLFEGGHFRPALEQRIARTFYRPPDSNEALGSYHQRKRQEFEYLLSGAVLDTGQAERQLETLGLANVIRKDGGTPFGQAYEAASLRVLRGLFVGRYVEAGKPFLGDAVWQADEKGGREFRALDYGQGEEHIHGLLEWVLATGERYADLPQLRNLFLAEKKQ